MSTKETFIIRTEWYEAISELSDSDKLMLFDNLFHYHMGNINLINLNNLTVKLVWKLIEPTLVRNIESYDKRRETSARNGALGGRKPNKPKKPDGLEEKPNNHDSVSVYVSDSVSVLDSDLKEKEIIEKSLIFPFTSDLFFEKWNLLISTPKWKGKVSQSLQISLETLSKYDEAFAIEMINQAIAGEWTMFKGFELDEYYKKYKSPLGTPQKEKAKRFKPPTVDEVKAYCQQRKNNVDAQKFVDFYQSKGWLVGKVKMKDWEACVRTWEKESPAQNGRALIDVEAIKKAKEIQEIKEKAKSIFEELQKRLPDEIKQNNPKLGTMEFLDLLSKTLKTEYISECEKLGIDKIIYSQFFT